MLSPSRRFASCGCGDHKTIPQDTAQKSARQSRQPTRINYFIIFGNFLRAKVSTLPLVHWIHLVLTIPNYPSSASDALSEQSHGPKRNETFSNAFYQRYGLHRDCCLIWQFQKAPKAPWRRARRDDLESLNESSWKPFWVELRPNTCPSSLLHRNHPIVSQAIGWSSYECISVLVTNETSFKE